MNILRIFLENDCKILIFNIQKGKVLMAFMTVGFF